MDPLETATLRLEEVLTRTELLTLVKARGLLLGTNFPEYLPPVNLEVSAVPWIRRAVFQLCRLAKAGDRFFLTGHYEDREDLTECCVVLSIRWTAAQYEEGVVLSPQWLERIQETFDELLCRSVAMKLSEVGNAIDLECRIPVYRHGSKRIRHRSVILLVEDEAYVRRSTREVLEMAGYNVLEAASGDAAQLQFERGGDGLCAVLTDLSLPGMNGREFANVVHARFPRLPVIVMSGYHHQLSADPAKCTFVLEKPYNSATLLEKIHECLRTHHRESYVPTHLLRPAEQVMPVAGA